MKIIPFYLPQFHQIPENDAWWGEGFTEWTNMKKAKPLFNGHNQPRIPLNSNYYDLSNIETLRWQCNLAKKYNIYGFCFYHYWFNGHMLLEKPMELLLNSPDIDMNFCISWANENWTNGWVSDNNKILIGHDFDDENDWVTHFNYLLKFFKDDRYIKEDGKPLVIIYVPHHIKKLKKMLNVWTDLAIKNGFSGLKYIYQNARSHFDKKMDKTLFDYGIEFNPGFIHHSNNNGLKKISSILIPKLSSFLQKRFKIYLGLSRYRSKLRKTSYDKVWQDILQRKPDSLKMIPTAFVDWDNTPRKGIRGEVYLGATPEKFQYYLECLIKKTRAEYNTDKIFMFAWNEWSEGGYLEPDTKNGFRYLEAVKSALEHINK